MKVALAVTYHDPEGLLYEQLVRLLPALADIFDGVAVQATHSAHAPSLALFAAAGARVEQEAPGPRDDVPRLGKPRRAVVRLALQTNLPFVLYCDCDRVLHWAERYPEELAAITGRLADHDFTVLGRTQRAFDSHPRIQRDTEAIINHVFATVSGHAWDVTAAARGLSRRAAAAILEGCPDETIGNDVSWPLFLLRAGDFRLGYRATEGLEFETGDRHADEIAAAGGYTQWLARLDADPRRWIQRLNFARVEIEAMLPYVDPPQ